MVSWGSLKFKLIMGFLFCAVLTAVSGGTGIFSLNQISGMMGQSALDISANVDNQHTQIRQLMPVRTLVAQTLEADDLDTINELKTVCTRLTQDLEDNTGAFNGIHRHTMELIETKQAQLMARMELKTSLNQTLGLLTHVTELTRASVRATEKDSISTMEKEIAALTQKFSSLNRSAVPGTALSSRGITDNMDELMMRSEMSISAVRAALSIQSAILAQQNLVTTLFHIRDPGRPAGLETQILSLQGNINSELVELPEDRTTKDLTMALADFTKVVKPMFRIKTRELDSRLLLKEKLTHINTLMHQVENGVLEASANVKNNVGLTMKNSRKIIEKWQLTQIFLAGIAILLALVIGLLVAASIVRPVQSAIDMLKDIARGEGDLTMRLTEKGRDEISQLSKWFNLFVEKIQNIIIEIRGNTQTVDQGSQSLLSLSQALSQGAENTSETAEKVAGAAQETSARMDAVARQSSEASAGIQSISSAVEQMTGSVEGIAENAAQTGKISQRAVDTARVVSGQVTELNLSAMEIGKVTQVIREISEQTHLLALNANIEAARAGEAGKGFAVVADEIRDLAGKTSFAIEEIKEKIHNIRGVSTRMEKGIQTVSATISKADTSVAAIISAVEDQSATTREIAGNLSEAAKTIDNISDQVSGASRISKKTARDISRVNGVAETIAADSTKVNKNAGELAELARTLNSQADQFTI